MQNFQCNKGCCEIKIKPYTPVKEPYYRTQRKIKKAGIFIYDPNKDKILIVQSRGRLWGLPKGTLQYGETERMCAIREVKEETGLEISDTEFTKVVKIKNRAIYFYVEREECNLNIQDKIPDNDVNALGWIKPDCLNQCIEDGYISLNQHCRIVFSQFMNRTFSHSTFVLVQRKKKYNKME